MPTAELQITGKIAPEFASILTQEALDFVSQLVTIFGPQRDELLTRRVERQKFIALWTEYCD